MTYIKAGCIIDVGFQPQSSSNVAVVEEMKENGVEFNFICNKLNDNIANYEALSSDGSHIEWKPDFADIIIDKVSAYGSDVISYYYGTGLFSNVCLTSDISYDWYRAVKGELTDEEIKNLGLPDTDGDGVYDFDEINWDYVTIKDGKIVLPTLEELCNKNSLMVSGMNNFVQKCEIKGGKLDISETRVLVVKSNLLLTDSDGDGLLDGDDENQWGWSIRDPEPTVYNNFIPFGTEAYFDDLEKTNPLNPDTIYLYMMKQVNSAEYYDLIPFEYWDAFCEYLNDRIKGVKIDEDLHYFRVKLNRAPESLDDMMKIDERKNWTLLEPSMSIYHMFNTKACYDEKEGKYKGEYNLKFVSHDGKYEAVYNYAGVLLDENNDPVNMGTYNYSDPNATLAVGHVIVDVFPYSDEILCQLISQLLGNSTTGLGNVPGTYIDCSSANTNFDRYADNLDAQNTMRNINKRERER